MYNFTKVYGDQEDKKEVDPILGNVFTTLQIFKRILRNDSNFIK
jgi:hypothetical protein